MEVWRKYLNFMTSGSLLLFVLSLQTSILHSFSHSIALASGSKLDPRLNAVS